MKGAGETAVVTKGAKLEAERVEEVKAVVAMAWKLGPGRAWARGKRAKGEATGRALAACEGEGEDEGQRRRRRQSQRVSVSVRVRVGLGSRTHLEVVDSC